LFKIWIILVVFAFSVHAIGSLSRFSEVGFKVLDLRPILAADVVLLFIGIAAFAGQRKTADRVLTLSLVVFVVEMCLSYHSATRNGIWGFDAVLNFGATERISSEGWRGVGAYPQLFATYDYPALSLLTSATCMTSSFSPGLLYAIVPTFLAIVGVVALLSLMKGILSIRNAMLATLVIMMYPSLFGGLYLLQTIATPVMIVALFSLLVLGCRSSTKNRGGVVAAILLLSLLIGHILEPYVLLLLAVYGLLYTSLHRWSKSDSKHSRPLEGRLGFPSLLIPKPVAIVIVVAVIGYWIFLNSSMLERFGGVILQLYEQQPLDRQLHPIGGESALLVFLDIGEHLMIVAFLGVGLVVLLVRGTDADRRLSSFLFFPLAIFVTTEFLVLFKSLHVQISRFFLWAWLFLIVYAIAHIDKGLVKRSSWKILLALFVVWCYGTVCSTEVFDGYYEYNYEKTEYKPYLLDSEIEAARWFNMTDGTILGDQGAWHLLTAFTSADVVMDIDAIDEGPDRIKAYDWYFFRYENLNLAFDAYLQTSTSVSLDELAAINNASGMAKVFDNGGAAIYRLGTS